MRFAQGLIGRLSLMLEEDEREAVLGDLAESETTAARAVTELLGLIAKRQAAAWADWRPWVALVFLVIPVGYLISQRSLALGAWTYSNVLTFWRTGERYHSGLTGGEEILVAACQFVALALWTWTSGFVLGSLARKTAWVQGLLFGTAWLCFFFLWPIVNGRIPPNAEVTALVLHALPFLAIPVLAFTPSLFGARRGARIRVLGLRQAIPLALGVAAVTALAIWTGTWQRLALERWSQGAYEAQAIDWLALLPRYAMLSWPVAYILATSLRRPRMEVGDPA
jgi:hypothetical protein